MLFMVSSLPFILFCFWLNKVARPVTNRSQIPCLVSTNLANKADYNYDIVYYSFKVLLMVTSRKISSLQAKLLIRFSLVKFTKCHLDYLGLLCTSASSLSTLCSAKV